MLAALERVGGTPIDTRSLHAFAFFANVLSPLWDLHPLEGSVLKDSGAPYFPTLQRELDSLVGGGFVTVVTLARGDAEGLLATFRLDHGRATPILEALGTLPDEARTDDFLTELADAFVEIRPDRRDDAAVADAAYSDPAVAEGRIVDFAEWVSPTRGNATWNTAQQFQRYVPIGVTLNRAEKLVMYMRLMKRRAHG
ncbi:hypothetical protein EN962_22845 [Mesorhizobium sp. M7A.F.Ca.CA.001.09.2.1]|uniref:Uncharacterized protein n=1 Tax=Mesorhizobium ciceri TaxID=39645 RepID=A0AB38TJ30_9HYPH|nr:MULTISPECIES: hypothetical protein [Mesorhizobium]RUY54521.1 hypothetical protein EN981_08045 [Mesorhizobium sp. M7A.F.Ca.CA.001.13.2.1]MDF3212485.1 hypothetical protein [Mesorhizobium ciceri]RUY64449.1 hypothetical protein EN980_25335 [Mesorhizobium sp. M7A.F.Ca.CA.001.13.1.1]RUY66759.1 hypothetical protein EN965_16620 [Mesorhizobium sp. M7A.F.Ca.CA.001.05.1.1]RUY75562.1 hypothetical protein EN962_22845 [Mesorhizobium sp. M7A.F.Ca.CA.001.09.2.1]